jgi:hypothetical protein
VEQTLRKVKAAKAGKLNPPGTKPVPTESFFNSLKERACACYALRHA